MIIVNLIDKQQLLSEDGDGASWGDGTWGGGVAWRARLFLFLGFALMAGGMAGSVVSIACGRCCFSELTCALRQTVLVIKYVLPPYPGGFGTEWGVANVIQSSRFIPLISTKEPD